jgi:hypothetical protein
MRVVRSPKSIRRILGVALEDVPYKICDHTTHYLENYQLKLLVLGVQVPLSISF